MLAQPAALVVRPNGPTLDFAILLISVYNPCQLRPYEICGVQFVPPPTRKSSHPSAVDRWDIT